MANYSVLKAAVEAVVKTNGNEEITGANLQSTLEFIIDSLGAEYQFVGVATTSTSPGTPDENVAYIGGPGTYSNFGSSITVPIGSVCLFKYNGSWSRTTILINDEYINEYRIDRNHIFSIPASAPDTVHYEATSNYDNIQFVINDNIIKVVVHGVVPTRFIFFDENGFSDENYLTRNTSGITPGGGKLCSITIAHSNLPETGYANIWIEQIQEHVDVSYMDPYIADVPTGKNYINDTELMYGYYIVDGQLEPYTYGLLSNALYLQAGETYVINRAYALSNNRHVIAFFDADGNYLSRSIITTGGGTVENGLSSFTFTYNPPANADHCRIELAASKTTFNNIEISTLQLEEGSTPTEYEAYSGSNELKSSLITASNINAYIASAGDRCMKVIKTGNSFAIRTALNDTDDIVITMHQDTAGQDMSFSAFYVGSKSLSDSAIVTDTYKVRTINDMVGAIGVDSFWYLYAQHGWTIPKFTASSASVDDSDVGSIWKDQNNRRFIIGHVEDNYIYLLPEISQNLSTGIYSASWDGAKAYPNALTHVSGAVHTTSISGSSARYDLPIQTITNRVFMADGSIITDDGTYKCNELVIKENIIGQNVGKAVQWFPTPTYNGSLIDFDRSFVFNGLSCSVNTTINVQYPFIVTDYRGCIPMMPLEYGDYHSYSFIPKVKKQVNSHRVDIPFNSDDGSVSSNYVSVTRNSTDLYDVNDQPDRCINYLKDDNGNYLVGMVGGCSLLRGLSKNEVRNQYVPVGQNTCTYGGDSTKNKFYPKLLQSAAFSNGIIGNDFINEMSCFFCWFYPTEDGQVFWYKDGDDFIVYVHSQSDVDKMAVNLPLFMEGLVAGDVIEKTDGASLLTDQVVGGRLYVSFDTTSDVANYIVIKVS